MSPTTETWVVPEGTQQQVGGHYLSRSDSRYDPRTSGLALIPARFKEISPFSCNISSPNNDCFFYPGYLFGQLVTRTQLLGQDSTDLTYPQ